MAKSTHTDDIKLTSLADLENYAKGQIVRLPDFAEGQPFIARIKRPSMLALIKSGKIPNSLVSTASELFAEGMPDAKVNENAMSELFQVLDCVTEACLVEPSYAELKKAGIELSDDQYMFIFNYTQRGTKALENFR